MGVTRLLLLRLFYTIQRQIYVHFCTRLYHHKLCSKLLFLFFRIKSGQFLHYLSQYWIAVWRPALPTLAHLTRQNSFYISPIIITFLGLGKNKKMWKFLMKHHFAKLYLHDAPLHDFHWHFPLFSITKWQIYSVKL